MECINAAVLAASRAEGRRQEARGALVPSHPDVLTRNCHRACEQQQLQQQRCAAVHCQPLDVGLTKGLWSPGSHAAHCYRLVCSCLSASRCQSTCKEPGGDVYLYVRPRNSLPENKGCAAKAITSRVRFIGAQVGHWIVRQRPMR